MSVTLHPPAEVERRLPREAERRGLDLASLISELVGVRLPEALPSLMTPAERAEAFRPWVAGQPLGRYIDEQAFRFNRRDGTDLTRFFQALKQITGKRLTYDALTTNYLKYIAAK